MTMRTYREVLWGQTYMHAHTHIANHLCIPEGRRQPCTAQHTASTLRLSCNTDNRLHSIRNVNTLIVLV